jgi:hypothetical protein
MAQYLALVPLWLPGGLMASPGDTISDSGGVATWQVPSGWIAPSNMAVPVDADGVSKTWANGAHFAEPWINVPRVKPTVGYWYPKGDGSYFLKGSENLGSQFPRTNS